MKRFICLIAATVSISAVEPPRLEQISRVKGANELRWSHPTPMLIEGFEVERHTNGLPEAKYLVNPLHVMRQHIAGQLGETYIWRDSNAVKNVSYAYIVIARTESERSIPSLLSLAVQPPLPITMPPSPMDARSRIAKFSTFNEEVDNGSTLVLTWIYDGFDTNAVFQVAESIDLKTWSTSTNQANVPTNQLQSFTLPAFHAARFYKVGVVSSSTNSQPVKSLTMDP